MRKVFIFAVALIATTGVALAGISNTAHNLAGLDTKSRVCIFCHTPHNAIQDVPLWNHNLSTQTYTAYTSDTMNAYTGTAGDWTGSNGTISALCMSCHDGTIARGSVANDLNGAVSPGTVLSGAAALGTDLTNDHPVSFAYADAISGGDAELQDPAPTNPNVLLFNGNVECASCHDPHTDDATKYPFLVDTNNGSNICFGCHIK